MMVEKAQKMVHAVRAELNHPIFMAAPGAKKAILAMAEAVEELAHEIEILKIRLGGVNNSIDLLNGDIGTLKMERV